MKTFAISVLLAMVFLLGALSEESPEKVNEKEMQLESCFNETGVNNTLVYSPFNETMEAMQDEKFDCFMACMYKKMNVMTPDGTINEEVARSVMLEYSSQKRAEDIMKCFTPVGNSSCETAGSLFNCEMKFPAIIYLN